MRGFIGILFMLYVVAAATSISLGQCGFGFDKAEEPEVAYCAIGATGVPEEVPGAN